MVYSRHSCFVAVFGSYYFFSQGRSVFKGFQVVASRGARVPVWLMDSCGFERAAFRGLRGCAFLTFSLFFIVSSSSPCFVLVRNYSYVAFEGGSVLVLSFSFCRTRAFKVSSRYSLDLSSLQLLFFVFVFLLSAVL